MVVLCSTGKTMKPGILALLAIALVAAASPAVIAMAAGASQAGSHANHSDHTRGVAQCTFAHPGPLPSQASPNAVD
ncbi:MAG TPA: hypothetical protein VKM96_06040, partial [Candidatus Bathyarchaeia archaeon]|nr:hypothetical protein [Candidatus Bathyarchaeia archaeon]